VLARTTTTPPHRTHQADGSQERQGIRLAELAVAVVVKVEQLQRSDADGCMCVLHVRAHVWML